MKIKTFSMLFLILTIILLTDFLQKNSCIIKEIDDNCQFGIDLNKDDIITDDEFHQLSNIYDFCSPKGVAYNEEIYGKFTEKQKLYFKIITKESYKRLFLHKSVKKTENGLQIGKENIEKLILIEGLAHSADEKYKKYENITHIKKFIENSKNKEFYIFNTNSKKYHKYNCKKVRYSKYTIFLLKENLPTDSSPCKYCIIEQANSDKNKNLKQDIIEKSLKNETSISVPEITVLQAFGINNPNKNCSSNLCLSLKKEIAQAKNTIDMAVYDLNNQPEIVQALIDAKNRGVKIRAVIDDSKINDLQNQTYSNIQKFSCDIYSDNIYTKDSHRLMHNKFFIFDKKRVWTGSTNITNTGISGFNTNSVVIINSEKISEIYENEFENFVNGKFHSIKSKNGTYSVINNNTNVTIYFSPKDKPISTILIPEIKKAQKYVYVPIFYLTHNSMAEELVNAHKRGVDVKVIIDATSARNKYSKHTILRNNSIPVKTENFAGKMHMKNLIIDDNIAFLGSMNFTKSGDIYNDENCIRIQDEKIVKYLKKDFLTIWNMIPDKYLHIDPRAEGPDSPGSCYDGIDNDFDGYIDFADNGCKMQ